MEEWEVKSLVSLRLARRYICRHLEMWMRLVMSISIRGGDRSGPLGRHYSLEPVSGSTIDGAIM